MAYAQSDFGDPVPGKPEGYGTEVPEKKPRGCWFYGCIVLIVLGVLGLIATAAGFYIAYNFYQNLLKEYTATAPVALPPLTITEEQRKSIDDRWKAFQEAADKGEPAELVLTADDLNALISENEELKGKVYISIEGSDINGKVSMPLDKIPLPGLSGRFFNGDATFTVDLEDGYLEAYIKSGEVNGKPIPVNIAEELAKQNILKDVKFDDETREKIRKVESLTVKDGKIYLKSREKKSSEDASKPETPAEKEAMPPEESKGDSPTSAEPKVEELKAEEPKVDAPKVEEPKAEEPKADAPAAELPKAA